MHRFMFLCCACLIIRTHCLLGDREEGTLGAYTLYHITEGFNFKIHIVINTVIVQGNGLSFAWQKYDFLGGIDAVNQ